MILYSNTCDCFIDDVNSLRLTEKIINAFESNFHRKVPTNETRSWENSLGYMERVVRNANVASDCGVLIEYNLPNSSKRIDFIITGEDSESKKNLVVVELKQWEKASATDMDGIVKTYIAKNIRETAHPSYQASGYKRFLSDFNEEIYSGNIEASSCAFLHNYHPSNPEPLLQESYDYYLKDSPIYFRNEHTKLSEFIANHVGKGNGLEILYAVENSKIKPSPKLIDLVGSLFNGNKYFTLLDEQKVLFEIVLHAGLKEKKQVIIIKGGPGTGKSVLSFNLLYGFLKKNRNAVLSAPNAAFREVMKKKLQDSGLKKKSKDEQFALDAIITGSSGFYGLNEDSYEVIIVDEAHRLKNNTAYQYQGESQVKDVINSGKTTIFFVDDNQVIRPEDIGSVKNIKDAAKTFNADIMEYELDIQFRCSGLNGYINWLDHTFQIKETANFDSWDADTYSFILCKTPNEVYERVKEKQNQKESARILAGYAWNWTSEKNGNPNGQIADVVIEEHQFAMPWNSRRSRSTWAIDSTGINQIGCIHTSQGLEFDYVGIIIGSDLKYDPETMKLYTSWSDYKDSAGKKGLKKNHEKLTSLVKNIYKTLLTRSIKGCFVYCCDKELNKYLKACLPRNILSQH